MKLNRALIKQQAKQLISGNVLKLFAISILTIICMSLPAFIFGGIGESYMILKSVGLAEDYGSRNNYNDFEEFGDFDDFEEFGDFDDFGYDMNSDMDSAAFFDMMKLAAGFYFLMILGLIATLLLAPLEVSLAGTYVKFIRGQRFDTDQGVRITFRESFKKGLYGKKLGVTILREIVVALLSYLFFIPGIIFGYSSYFFAQIMCDYPELSPWQAIKLSKKIVKGNRTELFVLDLSFIPWMLLSVFLFPLIYVIPYMSTTVALYYENFRIRAIQEGRVTEDDFLSDRQKYEKYMAQNPNGGAYNYQQPPVSNGQSAYNPQQTVNNAAPYYNPQQPPVQNNAPFNQPAAGEPEYYTPPQETPDTPVENEPPAADEAPQNPDTTQPAQEQTAEPIETNAPAERTAEESADPSTEE